LALLRRKGRIDRLAATGNSVSHHHMRGFDANKTVLIQSAFSRKPKAARTWGEMQHPRNKPCPYTPA
jgi:hypothetical protein